jgi:nuclear polyadenylated RNA-binding protein NAB2
MSGISLETPLAEQLNAIVHQKITEEGWSTEEDTSLAEYIVLMLVNGKTQEQISSELASELLQDVDGIPQFAQWLSDQVAILKNGADVPASSTNQQMADATSQSLPDYTENTSDEIPAAYDTDMGDNAPNNALVVSKDELEQDADFSDRPKGPKNLHGARPSGRGGRMGGQMNKAMDRSGDSVLHRVRGQGGSGRIDSHTKGAPKGPRGSANRAGLQKALSGIATASPTPGMPNPMMQAAGQSNPMMPTMSPQQQMEFMAMMEQQARMMAQFTGMVPGVPGTLSPGFQQNGQGPNSQQVSLFDRVQAPGRGGRGGRGRGRGFHQNGTTRNGSGQHANGADTESNAPSSMEVESSSLSKPFDPSTTMCKFNKRCINQDCPYAHVSPAAPDNTPVDMNHACSFGVACKNSKCTGRHPSPAQLKAHHAEEICRFFPNCANPVCSYKHPTAPPCRNGADCTREGCTFTHLQTMCKFNPCTNRNCPYKHADGQKVKAHSNVWVAEGVKKDTAMGGAEDGQQHVSNRKFVEEGAEEELIKPEEEEERPVMDENDVENIGAAQAEGIIA